MQLKAKEQAMQQQLSGMQTELAQTQSKVQGLGEQLSSTNSTEKLV